MNRFFKLKEHNVTIKSELIAALTSFFAAVYIIVVNSSILSDSNIPMEPLIVATILASFTGCLLVSLLSNTPLIVMPGMGINALFTYTIINTLGLNFYEALASVFVSGILFSIIALTPVSNILTKAIPKSLKEAITVGIGLFIAFIGFQKAGLIVSDQSTLIKLANINNPNILAFLFTMIVTTILFSKKIPGAFLISIIVGTIISLCFGIVDLTNITYSLPNFSDYKDILFKISFSAIWKTSFWISVFSITLVIVFENIGLLHGQVSELLNTPDKTPRALTAIAFSVIGCGLLGTSPSVSTVEGTAGIAAGGKTGLTSLITGFLFLCFSFHL